MGNQKLLGLFMVTSSFPVQGRASHYYRRLLQAYGVQEVAVTLQQLADLCCCTRRHLRTVLGQLQQQGWIRWQASAGRGRRASLQCLHDEPALQRWQAEQLLVKGQVEEAMALTGVAPSDWVQLLLGRAGQVIEGEQQILRVPYYRPLPTLDPGAPLRRSEVHLIRQIFNGLTSINEENGEAVADLAHDWQQVSACCWRFYLRPGVRWHDGGWLTMQDVVASLEALRTLPLYRHLLSVTSPAARQIEIVLQRPDARLPWLLAQYPAMIRPLSRMTVMPADRPVGTGPYRVVENTAQRLRLQAFDDYFGYRALLDEVDIWMWPALAEQMAVGEGHICGLRLEGETEPETVQRELVLEQGGYFLLYDAHGPAGLSTDQRDALQQMLGPWQLMQAIPEPIRRRWTPAVSLLPHWLHHLPPSALPAVPAWPRQLRMAYCAQQPEYRTLARWICRQLESVGIAVICDELPFAAWWRGDSQADLWLGSITFSTPPETALAAWLCGTPLLRSRLAAGGVSRVDQWLDAWRSDALTPEALMRQVMQAGWLQPLFHHWLELQGPPRIRGARLNDLGWFDFRRVWLAPEA